MKMKKLEEQYKIEKESTETVMKKQHEEFENKIKELEERMVQVSHSLNSSIIFQFPGKREAKPGTWKKRGRTPMEGKPLSHRGRTYPTGARAWAPKERDSGGREPQTLQSEREKLPWEQALPLPAKDTGGQPHRQGTQKKRLLPSEINVLLCRLRGSVLLDQRPW